ncbi:MAG: class I SAM-dependent methyltransferase, partial [Planctomycetota bacterium]
MLFPTRYVRMKTRTGNIYDFPNYYDLVFGSDTAAELRFLRKCFGRFVTGEVARVFEPACGTGRLIYKLGKHDGLEVSGVDLNERAVAFCNRRLERSGIRGRAFLGDMSDFSVERPYDAAFNTINSFRHLPSEEAARGHFLHLVIRRGEQQWRIGHGVVDDPPGLVTALLEHRPELAGWKEIRRF